MAEQLLTVGEVATLAGVADNTVRWWVDRRKLTPSHMAGKLRLFRRRDVIRFLEARKKQHTVT